MMKNILILLVAMTLVGCAAGGGTASSVPVVSTPLPAVVPGCKALNSVWTSTTDSERHDFTNVLHNVPAAYVFQGRTGQTCGFPNNPSNSLTVLVETPADYQYSSRPWDYRLNLTYSLALGGDCATYGTGPLDKMQVAFIKVSCNAIQICNGTNDVAPFNCKTFN